MPFHIRNGLFIGFGTRPAKFTLRLAFSRLMTIPANWDFLYIFGPSAARSMHIDHPA